MSTVINVPINDMCIREIEPNASPWSSIPRECTLDWSSYSDQFFCKLSPISSAYNTKIIERAVIKMSVHGGRYYYGSTHDIEHTSYRTMELSIWGIKEPWDSSTLCISNTPRTQFNASDTTYYWYGRLTYVREFIDQFEVNEGTISLQYDSEKLRELITYGFYFTWCRNVTEPQYGDPVYPAFISKGTDLPTLELTLSDTDNTLSVGSCSPTSGYRAKYNANTYTWSTLENNFSAYAPTVTSSKFRWRTSSSATPTVIDCGTALSYTMPANTVSTDTFEWSAEITDNTGHVSTSDWYTISTLEATSTATIVEPKNVTIDGSSANRFEWLHNISTGTSQTKADLQYSTDNGSTWTQFATAIGSSTNTIIQANTFIAGSYIWRVRTYNTDNVAGSWSETKPFTVIAKPTVSAVTSEQNPKPKITWQSAGQQAYRVYINDVFDSGVLFGTNNYYNLPIYLDDGTYTVNVIVQNSFGLWSDEGSAPIIVNNTAGTPMTLIGINSSDGIVLSWTSVLSYAYYVVYRDNVPIAKIRDNTFTDHIALGQHSYFIRGIYASSKNYGLSNTIDADISVDELMITNLGTYESLSIELTDSSYAELYVSDEIQNTSIYISASDYPINEISHFKSKSISFECAFTKNSDLSKRFKNMLGKLVCIKTTSGTSVVGNLLQQQKRENYFFEKYSCILNQTNYGEEIQL